MAARAAALGQSFPALAYIAYARSNQARSAARSD
jgi:hypothetical protein